MKYSFSQSLHKTRARSAFTLMELILSLALIVVATALLGSLMGIYARSFSTRGDSIKQKQLARSLLTMMADDIRAVVVAQQYDDSVLQQMLGGSSGSASTGTGGTGTGSGTGGTGTGSTSTGGSGTGGSGTGSTGTGTGTGATAGGSSTGTGSTGGSATEQSSGTETDTSTASTALPPGIYGSQYQLMVDVSRIPRTSEYNQTTGSIGMLSDVPGDVKSVTYLLQSGGPLGVQDSMLQVSTASQNTLISNSGLVRRAIDRNVLKYAEENATATSLNSTGDLVAPEVVAMEFSFYDGTQWLYDWDSSQQGLPWLVQITLALQSPESAEANPIVGGITLSTLTVSDQQAYGIQVFQMTVAIPGANLQAAGTSAQSSGSGMQAMGL